MRNLFILAALVVSLQSQANDGILFSKESYAQLLEKAKATNKIIFIDFYATWCGPCKGMERDVFPNPEVAVYFNEHFISKRIDAEKEELELVGQMKIMAYPTLAFFDPNGKLIYKLEGAPDANEMLEYGNKVTSLVAMISSGSWKNNAQNLRVYLESLTNADPVAAEKIAAEYLSALPLGDLNKEENYWILVENIHDIESPLWKYVLNNLSVFGSAFESLPTYIEQLGENEMQKAVTKKSPATLKSKTDMDFMVAQLNGDSSRTKDYYLLLNQISYCDQTFDKVSYATKLHEFLKKYLWNESGALIYYSSKIVSGSYSQGANKNAIIWLEQALKLDAENYLAYWVLSIGSSNINNTAKSSAALQNFFRLSSKDAQLKEKINAILSN